MKSRLSLAYLSALFGAASSFPVRAEVVPRRPEDYDTTQRRTRSKARPNKLSRAQKRNRAMFKKVRRAGIQGNGLWRRNAAQNNVRGH